MKRIERVACHKMQPLSLVLGVLDLWARVETDMWLPIHKFYTNLRNIFYLDSKFSCQNAAPVYHRFINISIQMRDFN